MQTYKKQLKKIATTIDRASLTRAIKNHIEQYDPKPYIQMCQQLFKKFEDTATCSLGGDFSKEKGFKTA